MRSSTLARMSAKRLMTHHGSLERYANGVREVADSRHPWIRGPANPFTRWLRTQLSQLVKAVDAAVGGAEVAEGVGGPVHLSASDLPQKLRACSLQLG